jgi:N-acetylglucosaminyl-diphospho-decaprenol L-rhamnosyltransferase
MQVIVVDNASTDGSCEMLRAGFPQVTLIRSPENLGFCRANNLALAHLDSDFALLLNSDTIVKAGSLNLMLAAMDENPTVGVLGPRLEFPDGKTQISFNSVPDISTLILSWSNLKQLLSPERFASILPVIRPVLGRSIYTYLAWYGTEPQTVFLGTNMYITGACLLVRQQVLREVGLLDPAIFLYVDDADFCKRVSNAGWKLMFFANATITHVQGGTLGKRYRWTAPYPYLSAFYYLRKHKGRWHFWIAKQAACLVVLTRWLWQKSRGASSAKSTRLLYRQLRQADGQSGYLASSAQTATQRPAVAAIL